MPAGRGLAVVDVQRAAVVERDADVVVAAEGVVPGQPVDQHRRLVAEEGEGLRDLLQVGAQHAVRVDHALGQLGRARGEQELGDRVRARPPRAPRRFGAGFGGQQVAKASCVRPAARLA
jgi:hypothetical protein